MQLRKKAKLDERLDKTDLLKSVIDSHTGKTVHTEMTCNLLFQKYTEN